MATWQADATDAGTTLAAFVKARAGVAWSVAKRHVETGKVFVDGGAVADVAHRLRGGEAVELRANAPRPRDPAREGELVFDDAHVVVIDKPAGISSVPYDDRETGTAMDLVRGAWRRMGKPATSVPLHVVHRIDRATSGLLAFAKTKRAESGMQAQLRAHEMQRTYLCVAHGEVTSRRIESHLVEDRGDGLRGSTTRIDQGKRAVTHVTARELLYGRDLRPARGDRGAGADGPDLRGDRGAATAGGAGGAARIEGRVAIATRCEVQLETGKTHQIRIHLSEAGHPLVGEPVYIRDFTGSVLTSARMMLHAATLGFEHPVTGEHVQLSSPLPPDFVAVLDRLRGYSLTEHP